MSKTLIIGGTGSLGRKLIERMLPKGDVAVYSRDEAKHWTIKNELSSGALATMSPKLRFYVGDVRDSHRIREVIKQYKPETVIIAAALKQVDTCELSPYESVQTNLLGTQNVVSVINDLSMTRDGDYLKSVLFVSTDKACSPVNVYGMCKSISERVVTSQAQHAGDSIRFLAVRYGNVLESRGSIIPLFKYQGMYGSCLTVTDPEMTRFLMTLDESVDLIETALKDGSSGETWIPKLPAMKIGYLANIFAQKYEKPIKYIGLRPGEKLHEDLINESESVRTALTADAKNYVIGPAFNAGSGERFVYSSDQEVYTQQQTLARLTELGIMDASLEQFKGLSIEEIKTSKRV
jgi:UDP-N-acetylglucosamine 4,6-dehydratase